MPVTYEDDVHPYTDLALGRVDAVLLDAVLAERGVRRNPGLVNQSTEWDSAITLASSRQTSSTARPDRRHAARRRCATAARGGVPALGHVERRSAGLYARVLADAVSRSGRPAATARPSDVRPHVRYLPALLRAAFLTLVLSCVAMALAVEQRQS